MTLHVCRWPWVWHPASTYRGMEEAEHSLALSEENLELADHLHRAAEGQAERLDVVRRRNGLVEAVRADWRTHR
jgi:hypothetical protein